MDKVMVGYQSGQVWVLKEGRANLQYFRTLKAAKLEAERRAKQPLEWHSILAFLGVDVDGVITEIITPDGNHRQFEIESCPVYDLEVIESADSEDGLSDE